MSDLPLNIVVKERTQLRKYREGADPEVDEPYEVLEQSRRLSDEEVRKLIDLGRLRITPKGKAEWIPEKKE